MLFVLHSSCKNNAYSLNDYCEHRLDGSAIHVQSRSYLTVAPTSPEANRFRSHRHLQDCMPFWNGKRNDDISTNSMMMTTTRTHRPGHADTQHSDRRTNDPFSTLQRGRQNNVLLFAEQVTWKNRGQFRHALVASSSFRSLLRFQFSTNNFPAFGAYPAAVQRPHRAPGAALAQGRIDGVRAKSCWLIEK